MTLKHNFQAVRHFIGTVGVDVLLGSKWCFQEGKKINRLNNVGI